MKKILLTVALLLVGGATIFACGDCKCDPCEGGACGCAEKTEISAEATQPVDQAQPAKPSNEPAVQEEDNSDIDNEEFKKFAEALKAASEATPAKPSVEPKTA